jgi:hypothetical protein
MLSSSPRVLALQNANATGVTVLRDRCSVEMIQQGDCTMGADLVEQQIELTGSGQVDQLLLSSNGRWLVVRSDKQLRSYDMDAMSTPDDVSPKYVEHLGPTDVESLVGSLRSGDWVVYRSQSGLAAYNLATHEQLTFPGQAENLFAVALGDRHIVARSYVGGGVEDLYMLTIDPYRAKQAGSSKNKAKFITRGDNFTRVVITRGETPEGETIPTDRHIVVTDGDQSSNATSRVFSAHTGDITDWFDGAVITSDKPMTNTEGLSATTPDGKSIAYITASNSVALRQPDDRGSCLVRSGRSGKHGLAGFAADGTLFFEAEERNAGGHRHDRIFSYNLEELDMQPLTPDTGSFHLKAVPHAAHAKYEENQARQMVSWAVATHESKPNTVQGQGVNPQRLGFGNVSYMPRKTSDAPNADQSLWLVEAKKVEGNENLVSLQLGRLTPLIDGDGKVQIDTDGQPTTCGSEEECAESAPIVQVFERVFPSANSLCVGTARIDGWARDCFTPKTETKGLSPDLPSSENPEP